MAYDLAEICISPQDEASSHSTHWFIDVLQHIIGLLPAKDKSKFIEKFMRKWSFSLSSLLAKNDEEIRNEAKSGITRLTKLSAVLMCMALET